MASTSKCGFVLVASIGLASLAITSSASAVTVEVARKCSGLANAAYPPAVAGNPAAGRANGTAQDLREYFNKCVANGGNMPKPEQPSNKTNQEFWGKWQRSPAPKGTEWTIIVCSGSSELGTARLETGAQTNLKRYIDT